MRLIACYAFLSTLAVPLTSLSEPVEFTVDKWHTRIYFSVSHMGLSSFDGRFTEHNIQFMFDQENLENSSVEVTVPVGSIDTFSPELNSKMGDEMFFDSANYPNMHFVSTELQQLDATHAVMTGDMTIRGTTLPVRFDVTINDVVQHPYYGLNNAGFTATATIDSRAFEVNQLPEWMVGSNVDIRIEMEAFEGDRVPYYSE